MPRTTSVVHPSRSLDKSKAIERLKKSLAAGPMGRNALRTELPSRNPYSRSAAFQELLDELVIDGALVKSERVVNRINQQRTETVYALPGPWRGRPLQELRLSGKLLTALAQIHSGRVRGLGKMETAGDFADFLLERRDASTFGILGVPLEDFYAGAAIIEALRKGGRS